ncbi:MAG: O-antigen ligase family protein, partial [Myxococcota bacterium]
PLDPGELGRWMSFSALVIVPLSLSGVNEEWRDRIGAAYCITVVAASVFALCTVALNARPGEWLVRGASNGIAQGRMPYDTSKTVAGGFYFHRLKFAHVATIGALMLLVRQLTVALSLRRRLLEGVGLLCIIAALFLTYVRADILGLAVGVFALGLFASRRSRMALAALAVVAIVVGASIPTVRERIGTMFVAQTSSERSLIWAQAVRIIADHPFGAGIGNYSKIVGAYYDLEDATFPTRTYGHNLWLTTWAETGPLGVMGLLGGFIVLAWRARERLPSAYALALISTIACLLTIGMTHDIFYDPPVSLSASSVIGYCATRLFTAPKVES